MMLDCLNAEPFVFLRARILRVAIQAGASQERYQIAVWKGVGLFQVFVD